MPYRRAFLLAALLALAPGSLTDVQAGEPTDQIRADIEELYRAVQETTPASSRDREAAAVLDRMFDWQRMAESALREHWQKRTSAERAEFTKLFAGLFRRAYVSRIHLIDATSFQYLGDTVDGDRATVETRALTKKGSPINVDYVTRLGEGQRWRVEDIRVERISLIDNYRAQFDTIITRSSFDALMNKLRSGAK